jgi:hypothetical protein
MMKAKGREDAGGEARWEVERKEVEERMERPAGGEMWNKEEQQLQQQHGAGINEAMGPVSPAVPGQPSFCQHFSSPLALLSPLAAPPLPPPLPPPWVTLRSFVLRKSMRPPWSGMMETPREALPKIGLTTTGNPCCFAKLMRFIGLLIWWT